MTVKIGFFTGARCEYGLSKPLVKSLASDKKFDLRIFATGMHLLKKFGHTIDEIRRDGFNIDLAIETYGDCGSGKVCEFTKSIEKIYEALKGRRLDAILIAGDRIESYSAALAAHFLKIPIIHLGGGAVTKGAVDDIYRANITNLAQMHLATSKRCYDRLISLDNIDKNSVYFFGSTAVDAIMAFKKKPIPITKTLPKINTNSFAAMTFHPVTKKKEPISLVMDSSIRKILEYDCDILITYPNNDEGCEEILKTIKRWQEKEHVFVCQSLGAEGYYSALNDCLFVIGNSSSGIIEAPYFGKPILNIGSRQEGRDKDSRTIDIPCAKASAMKAIDKGFKSGWAACNKCNFVYGNGESIPKTKKAILEFLQGKR